MSAGTTLRADLCIVGAGAAGITIAQALAGSGLRVVVLESGGLKPDRLSQSLYAGRIEGSGQVPLDRSRLRWFGGTTNHWEGQCGPLDPFDFQPRSWVPHSGWPFAREVLDPFYARAHEVCDLGPYDYGADAWGGFAATPQGLAEVGSHVVLTQYSPPTRFGEKYRGALAGAENVRIVLHANALELVPNAEATRVTRVEVSTLEGKRLAVEARTTVLACGAIENARLLLLSNRVRPQGLGNENDLVGRFFLDHPRLRPAGVVLWRDERSRRLAEQTVRNGVKASLGVHLDPAVQKRETLLQSCLFFFDHGPPEDTPEVDAEDTAILTWLQRLAGDDDPPSLSVCWMRCEQAPRSESRVRLSEERDALGQRRVVLEWRMGELNRHTHEKALRLYAENLTRAGLARVRLDPDVLGSPGDLGPRVTTDWHQMGTTRMATDPRQGVVGADCRVFGVENLFIAGASVFPTGGWMNPTLTLVALALRLADHLLELSDLKEGP